MQFEGSGNIYTYNYMYSNASAIAEEIGLNTYGKGIAIVTFSAFMLESYFNHVCQVIFDVNQRVNDALDCFTNKDFFKMKELKLPNLPFNEKIAIYRGYNDQFATLKKCLRKKVNSKEKDFFDGAFSLNRESEHDFEFFDKKYHFSPRLKYKAILKSFFKNKEYNSMYEKVDLIFEIQTSERPKDIIFMINYCNYLNLNIF